MALSQLYTQPVTASRQGISNNFLSSLGMSRAGEGALLPGQGGLQFSPNQVASNAPVYDWNTNPQAARASAQAGGSMGAGWERSGVNAFLPGDLNFFDLGGENWKEVQDGETQVVNPDQPAYRQAMADSLTDLAKKFGYDISGYDLSAGYQKPHDQNTIDQYKALGITLDGGKKNMQDLYDDLNKDLSNFQRIRGASAGWDGKGNMRSTAETMYYQVEPGKWVPISSPASGVKQEHKGWAREDGAELIKGLSTVLPAFGGWAGMLGQGVGGTLTAGGGLGLTSGLSSVLGSGLANTLVNTVMNGIMSGGDTKSLLAGLGTGILSQGATGLASGKSLGDIFGGSGPNLSGNYTGLSDFLRSPTGLAVQRTPAFRAAGGGGLNQLLQAGSKLANSLGA